MSQLKTRQPEERKIAANHAKRARSSGPATAGDLAICKGAGANNHFYSMVPIPTSNTPTRKTPINARIERRLTLHPVRPNPVSTMDSFQQTLFKLKNYWAERGAIIQEPYDIEVGAGTMCPETFLRVLGPKPYRVAYVQPSRRPADGRYGENPNRLYKHQQLQVILKPTPNDVLEQYLGSLEAIGIDFTKHDIKFEEDNWEAPTLGAWGIGWQVTLDGLEISQFTYFQQCGGIDLELVPAEITYGLERLTAFLQGVDSVYDIVWAPGFTYGDVRMADEVQSSVYNFEMSDAQMLWKAFALHEGEAQRLIDLFKDFENKPRFPVLPTYEQVLKCSNLFNLLDARGAISVNERAGMIARVRKLAVAVAAMWTEQQQPEVTA